VTVVGETHAFWQNSFKLSYYELDCLDQFNSVVALCLPIAYTGVPLSVQQDRASLLAQFFENYFAWFFYQEDGYSWLRTTIFLVSQLLSHSWLENSPKYFSKKLIQAVPVCAMIIDTPVVEIGRTSAKQRCLNWSRQAAHNRKPWRICQKAWFHRTRRHWDMILLRAKHQNGKLIKGMSRERAARAIIHGAYGICLEPGGQAIGSNREQLNCLTLKCWRD